jgi:thiamine-monophosphate kinase
MGWTEREVVDVLRAAFARNSALQEHTDDDAAVLALPHGVASTDVFVDGVDCARDLYPWAYAGHRALAQNLADVDAMGAAPRGFLWALSIPKTMTLSELDRFAGGAATLAAAAHCPLLGGDISSTSGPFQAAITIFGDAVKPWRRSGARVGDGVYVSRPLGASAAGLALLLASRNAAHHVDAVFAAWRNALSPTHKKAVDAHILTPRAFARVDRPVDVTAAMDISDGLSADAHRLARSSNVSIRIDDERRLVADGARLDDALHGGEDHALLFTSPTPQPHAIRIGRVVYDSGVSVLFRDAPLPARGFDHGA